jgi:hypothetical protein
MAQERKILEGVPRIGYNVHMCPFPGTLYAYLKYTGDPVAYDYLMGITGAAFRRLWNRDDGGNVGILRYEDEPFRQAFAALGYGWSKVPAVKETMVAAIKECLGRNRPAISFGILGPPEPGLVTGYDENGAVLFGWSYFQPNPAQYYETRDWYETMDKCEDVGLLIVGDKQPTRPSARDVLIASLKWALDLERTPKRSNLPDHVSGLAAYDAWTDALQVDADYPADNPAVMDTRCMIYGDQIVMLEERRSAAGYLRLMAEAGPEAAAHLHAAAALYDEAGSLASVLWPWGGASFQAALPGLTDPDTRHKLAGDVRAAGAKEAEAVGYLERALAALR